MQISGISSHISNANISGKLFLFKLNKLKIMFSTIGNNPISFKGLNQNASQLPTQP